MKNEKKVKIKIFATVMRGEGEDIEKDNIRITSEGVMSFDGKRLTICYDEIMGEDGLAQNVLSFEANEPNMLTLERSGAVSCIMTFSENGRYGGLYNMGFASFDFTVVTKHIANAVTYEKGGVLRLDYSTEIQNVPVQTSRFRFDISPL